MKAGLEHNHMLIRMFCQKDENRLIWGLELVDRGPTFLNVL